MQNLFSDIITAAQKDAHIQKLYVFGSYARGESTIFSDVDIAVIHCSVQGINRAALNEATAKYDDDVQFTYIEADVFDSDNHPLHVSSSIKREGQILWER